MIRPIGVLCAAAALLPGCANGPDAGDLDFTPAMVVSHETENGATPMFLATPRGDRVVAWISAPGGSADGTLHLSVTEAGAERPRPTVSVRDPLGLIEAHGEAPPQLAVDSTGSLAVLYLVGKEVPGERFPVSALRFIRSTDLGRTWTEPVTVNDGGRFGPFGAHNFHALTASPDGSYLATWLDGREGSSGVWMSRSTNGGRSWEPNRPIYSDPTCPCCRTAVAVGGDGAIYVAWRAILPGDIRDVVVMKSVNGGKSWNAPVRARTDGWVYPGCPHAGPAMRVDARGAVHIVWWTGKSGEAGVYYARSVDGGRSFTARPIAVGEQSQPAHVQLALSPAGTVLVAWDDGHGEIPRVFLRRSSDGGSSFGRPVLLSDRGVAAGYPVLAVYGDSVAVAWSQTTAVEHRARLAARAEKPGSKAPIPLPRVGQSEILMRTARL
jgi:BNR repeat-like domain